MSSAIVWGLEASPFLLKLEAMLRFHERPFRRLPAEGGWLENVGVALRLQRAKARGEVLRHPQMDPLDELPAVPFFSEDGRRFHYDTSALGHWLDDRSSPDRRPLFPVEPKLRFVAQLIDEAFDEFGLYMVHHMRWVGAAADTTMPALTAHEMSHLFTPLLAPLVRRHVARRQVRRCPYLFSVAPEGYRAGVGPARTPPSRPGFPPTHDLLHEAWCETLGAMESLLAIQPWILGDRFTIADASAYGQLSMNLIDPSAERELRERAPRTRRWLAAIREGEHVASSGSTYLSRAVDPLLGVIMSTFAPLMTQNERAWRAATQRGATHFNEAAFDRGEALYDGVLRGHAFRSVAKTFQVRVWRDLRESWRVLSEADRAALRESLPGVEVFDADAGHALPSESGL